MTPQFDIEAMHMVAESGIDRSSLLNIQGMMWEGLRDQAIGSMDEEQTAD